MKNHLKNILSETLLAGDDDDYEGGDVKFSLNAEKSESELLTTSIAPDAEDNDLGEGLEELQQYKDIFNNLTDKHVIDLGENMAIIEIIISYDSKRCIVIARNEKPYVDETSEATVKDEFVVFIYSLDSFSYKASFKIQGTYVRMNEIVQTDDASQFAIAYQDNGIYHIRVFNKKAETIVDIPVCELLGIEGAKPIHGLYHPLVTCCFLPGNRLFVCAYHRNRKMQYHFIYSLD